MTKKRNKREPADQIEEALELLFGSESELTDEELDADLRELGVDRVVLERKAHQHLREAATHHFSSIGREVPREMNKAIAQLRPPSLEQEQSSLGRSAQQRIEDVMQAVRVPGFIGTLVASAEMPPQLSFRNRDELTESDLELLESEQTAMDVSFGKGNDNE